MKRRAFGASGCGLLILLLACAQAGRAQSPAAPRDDQQLWNEFQLLKPLTKTKDLIIIGVMRIGRGFERPVDERIGAAVAFKLRPYLTVAPTYLYVDQQPSAVGARIREHRLVLNVTGKFKFGELTVTDRNHYERRVRHDSADFTMYRNRLQLDYPLRLGEFQFKPFIADEVWYSTQAGGPAGRQGWFRNRLGGGILKQVTKQVYAEFFYLHQNDGISRPGNVHALGMLWRFSLE
jgi:hypothetical protein